MRKLLFLLLIITSFSSCVVIAPRKPFYKRGIRPNLYSPRTHKTPFIRQHKSYRRNFY